MKKIINNVAGVIIFLTIVCCSREVKLNLPVYQPKMVLEFYLEDNKALNCVLQQSINYTDTTFTTLINNALVILKYNGNNDTLANQFYFDKKYKKFYNYHNPKVLHLLPGVKYEVYIKDTAGREMEGETRVLPVVSIDTQIFRFNTKGLASAGMVFKDNGSTRDYYRVVAFKDSAVINQSQFRANRLSDDLFNGQLYSSNTRYSFSVGDTITGRLYHLTEAHYNFLESVSNAQSSNGNPFGQPANIISNVTGGIGIFTTLNYDEKRSIVK